VVLNAAGIDGERLHLEFCSAAEGRKFQQTAIDMNEKILKMGPNPGTKAQT